ncbi:MAG: hypothetical protein ISS01_00830 [Nanoarchaeota archaeon]|nr:hypothetical protein [Nanoarchaeota archaeon]
MIISFYEEFPKKSNLDKIKLITFPTKLFIAASTLNEFQDLEKKINQDYPQQKKYIKEIAYWPILKKKEGYWFSAFTQRKALKRTIKELEGKDVPLMWDAELPTHQNFFLYFTQFFNFLSNRKLINKFIKSHKKVYVAEYFFVNNWMSPLFRLLCLNFPPSYNISPMRMAYSSLHDFGNYLMEKEITKGKEEFGDNFIMGYGTLCVGILGWEKPISLELLKRDLDLAQKHNLKEVTLFRLGGLNKEYLKLIKNYTN